MKDKHIIEVVKKTTSPKVIILGGMHGNEISGIDAIQKSIQLLKNAKSLLQGTIYFLKGNIGALAKKERFLDKDLNRLWQDQYISDDDNSAKELKELKELHDLIVNKICQNNFDDCYFLDLHTFSAQSGIFCIPAGNKKSLDIAASFHIPFIEKLAESLPGTAITYLGNKGMTGVVLEGGTHNTPEATENLVAGILHFLAQIKVIDNHCAAVKNAKIKLQNEGKKYPYHLELSYRHQLENSSVFKMNEGYYNFKRVEQNEILAQEKNKNISSPSSGYMLMPLYQKKGSDGFFIVKEIKDIYQKENHKTN